MSLFRRLLLFSCGFALFVVMLGAYTRLTDAGLGCPDWPGCYGQMIVAESVVESTKAWTEMLHRYFAGCLGLFIAGLTIASIIQKRSVAGLMIFISLLVIFQAALGMWTVTWKLHPSVVMGHLLGGMLIFSLLWLAFLKVDSSATQAKSFAWKTLLRLGVLSVFVQIALGGWTSSNYAAMACIDFPTCNASWWPTLHMKEAFELFHPICENYEGGVFSHDVRVTIQFIHRLGALCVASLLIVLAGMSLRQENTRTAAQSVLVLLFIQIALGISNILLLLPLSVAVLHNGVAALLLAAMVTLCFRYDHPRGLHVR